MRFGLTLLGLGGPMAAAFGAAQTFLQGLPLLAAGLVLAAATLGGLWPCVASRAGSSLSAQERRAAGGRPRLLSDREPPARARAG